MSDAHRLSDGAADYDPAAVNAYALLTALVVPRPIAWVSTRSAEGIGNLAPHSFFTVASADPPTVAFTSVGTKDSLRNIRATEEFSISVAPASLIDEVNATSAGFAPEVDEAASVGLAMKAADLIGAPYVADSPAALECRLHTTVEIGSSTMVFGTVVRIHVATSTLDGKYPAFDRLDALARLGGPQWALPGEVVSRRRPD